MTQRRLLYTAALLSALVFYWCYRQWLSWLLLLCLAVLPWFSLLVSLPAILTCRLKIRIPGKLIRGEQETVALDAQSPWPLPMTGGSLQVACPLTGENRVLRAGETLPSAHCGQLLCSVIRGYICDYLGLFRIPAGKKISASVTVLPRQIHMDTPPDVSRYLASAFKPKPGGGFAENHELRLYRPGDSLRQVHWKLSAKTGKLVYREPMEAIRGTALLSLRLSGSPEQLDDKLERLQFLSRYLLEKDIPHKIACLAGSGMHLLAVTGPEESTAAVEKILAMSPAGPEQTGEYIPASWHYHIGGDGDEA